jgi:hypothetical protein
MEWCGKQVDRVNGALLVPLVHHSLTPRNTCLNAIMWLKTEANTQSVKTFPVFYRIWKFITVFTWGHHWAPYWNNWIQSHSQKYATTEVSTLSNIKHIWSERDANPDLRGITILFFIYLTNLQNYIGRQGSSVSIVSGYGLDDRAIEVRSPEEVKWFLL